MTMITSTQFKEEIKTGVEAIKQKEANKMQVTIEKTVPTEKKSLYEVNMDLAKILEKLEAMALNPEDQDATEIEELQVMLSINDGNLEDTIERYAWAIGEMKTRAQYLKDRAKSMQDIARAKESVIDKLEERIKAALDMRGVKKIETDTHTVSLRKSEAVSIHDEASIPAIYVKTKLTSAPDKTEIKRALKQGLEVKGAVIVERQSVQIK